MLEPPDQAAKLEGIEADRAAEMDRGELPALDQALHRARVDMEELSGLACCQERGPIGDVAGGCHLGRHLSSGGFRSSRFELRAHGSEVNLREEFEGELTVSAPFRRV